MSHHIENNLGPGEKVIIKAKFSYLAIIPKIIGVIFGVILFSIGKDFWSILCTYIPDLAAESVPEIVPTIFACIGAFPGVVVILVNLARLLSLFNAQLVITNKRIVGKVGVLSIKALDYPIEKIDNVELKAGLFGNIFHYYDLSVRSAGDTTNHQGIRLGILFSGISNAIEFKNQVTFAIEQHAEEARRLQAEEIARAMSSRTSAESE